jgi:cytoskeletal protein CcmA (bactofilin family)
MSTPETTRDLTGIGEIHALLGKGARFSGTLTFEGRVRIDGELTGQIQGDGVLVIGEGAHVEASIDVGTLIVRGGTLRGNVSARQLVEVHPQAAVYGDITAPEIDIAKGCTFEGRCSMIEARPSGDRESFEALDPAALVDE